MNILEGSGTESFEPTSLKCEYCAIFFEAFREAEQQRRDFEDEHLRALSLTPGKDVSRLRLEEEMYQYKLAKLERWRNASFDVLVKHQQLEH
jgi:hypothetical protein